MRPPHWSHQEKGEERIRPPVLLGFPPPSHLLRMGLAPGQRDRHLHSPPSAAPAGMVPSHSGCLCGLAGRPEASQSPKPWYNIASAQLILGKLRAFPGAPWGPSHAPHRALPSAAQLPLQAPPRVRTESRAARVQPVPASLCNAFHLAI